MDDDSFFDELYAQWARTTGAESMFWMPEEDSDEPLPWQLYAVSVDAEGEQSRKYIGSFQRDEDVHFIAGIHGAVADLIRRLHDAIDEADRLDREKDEQESRIAELEQEVDRLRDFNDLHAEKIVQLRTQLEACEQELELVREERDFFQHQKEER